jgi:glycerophosphoryl diester phosphodiesterase
VTRPELIAHRGASRERPENTLLAFERAIELGADGVEFDLHLHADGVIRIHHDPLPVPPHAPTLASVLTLLGGAGRAAYCELKGPGTASGALAAISASGGNGAVHAFDHRQIAEARQLAPEIPRGVLESSYPVKPLAALEMVGGRDLWQHRGYIDVALVTAAHTAGARVIAWTVNAPAEIERFAAMRVDAICTDDIALARSVLGR